MPIFQMWQQRPEKRMDLLLVTKQGSGSMGAPTLSFDSKHNALSSTNGGRGSKVAIYLETPISLDLGNRSSQRGTQGPGVRAGPENNLWKESREPEPHVRPASWKSKGNHPLPDL